MSPRLRAVPAFRIPKGFAEANIAHVIITCKIAGVALRAFDARVVTWLASWELETCAVVAALISRAAARTPESFLRLTVSAQR